MPEKIISYDNLTRFKENLDRVLDDKQDALVSGENVKSINGASIIGSGDVDTNGNIAPEFNASSTYEVGDVVVYQHVLYKCVTAVSTAGAWDSSKWAQTTVADELGADIVTITATGVQSDEMDAKIRNAKALVYNDQIYLRNAVSASDINFVWNDSQSNEDYFKIITYAFSSKTITLSSGYYDRVRTFGGQSGVISLDASLTIVPSTHVTKLTGKLPYLTTAPSADNTSGFITIVVLSAEPATRYNGFLYIVTSSSN